VDTLIFSQITDFSTNDVIDWFLYYHKNYKRYNGIANPDGLNNFSFERDFFYSIPLRKKKHKNSIWFRRPSHDLIDATIELPLQYKGMEQSFNKAIKFNDKVYKELFVQKMFNRKLGSYTITGLNKPIILSLASEYGLDIPETIVTNSKVKVELFLKKNGIIINKALHEAFSYSMPGKYWVSNKIVEINSKTDIPNDMDVSLFQKKIEKQYEIRTFYLDESFYSACIFSQTNDKTELDFRNYDFEKPNRIVPYKLPVNIEKKVKKLMKKLRLNTGSIDFIKSKSGEYIFLEINPVGQFGFISDPCNYNLELEIFKFLTYEKK